MMPTPPKSPPSKIVEGHDKAHADDAAQQGSEQEETARQDNKGRPAETRR